MSLTRPFLRNLILANRGKGTGLRAEGNVLNVDDVILSTDEEADWWGGVSAQSFRRELKGMTGDVEIRINSPGGDVFAAVSMKQAMAEHDGEVLVTVDGLAASAASVVAAAGDRVLMAPGSMMMIHKAWTIDIGNADDFRASAELLGKIDEGIAAGYAARGRGDAAHYLALMAAETWFTAAEAVSAGLADEALPETVEQRRAKAAWDLSAYARAPRAPEAEPEPSSAPDAGAAIAAAARRARLHAVRMRT